MKRFIQEKLIIDMQIDWIEGQEFTDEDKVSARLSRKQAREAGELLLEISKDLDKEDSKSK